jgi:hypothetical protein
MVFLQEEPGKRDPTSVEEGPDVASVSTGDLTAYAFDLNLSCGDPLVYRSSTLFKSQEGQGWNQQSRSYYPT